MTLFLTSLLLCVLHAANFPKTGIPVDEFAHRLDASKQNAGLQFSYMRTSSAYNPRKEQKLFASDLKETGFFIKRFEETYDNSAIIANSGDPTRQIQIRKCEEITPISGEYSDIMMRCQVQNYVNPKRRFRKNLKVIYIKGNPNMAPKKKNFLDLNNGSMQNIISFLAAADAMSDAPVSKEIMQVVYDVHNQILPIEKRVRFRLHTGRERNKLDLGYIFPARSNTAQKPILCDNRKVALLELIEVQPKRGRQYFAKALDNNREEFWVEFEVFPDQYGEAPKNFFGEEVWNSTHDRGQPCRTIKRYGGVALGATLGIGFTVFVGVGWIMMAGPLFGTIISVGPGGVLGSMLGVMTSAEVQNAWSQDLQQIQGIIWLQPPPPQFQARLLDMSEGQARTLGEGSDNLQSND